MARGLPVLEAYPSPGACCRPLRRRASAFRGDALAEQQVEHAATGLAAAWALTRFAAFRIATIYLPTDPSPALLERLGYREDARGANLWLVVPNDEGVFQGAVEKDGIRCVHPAQVYVDLKDHPETVCRGGRTPSLRASDLEA